MANLMTQVYIGYIVEVMKDNHGIPTMDMRVRIPSVHGVSSKNGLPDKDLPLAKPLIIPGMIYNRENIEEIVSNINKVYIIFEGGNYTKPVYFGIKNESSIYNLQTNNSFILYYDSISDFPSIGNIAYLYRALDTNILYYYDTVDEIYKNLYNFSGTSGDELVGTVTLNAEDGPTYGLREIDGVQTVVGDKVMIVNVTGLDNAIYSVTETAWTKVVNLSDNQVISVDKGVTYGGTMLKLVSGVLVVVKKSELTKWNYIS
jgi:hypothetical protein